MTQAFMRSDCWLVTCESILYTYVSKTYKVSAYKLMRKISTKFAINILGRYNNLLCFFSYIFYYSHSMVRTLNISKKDIQ